VADAVIYLSAVADSDLTDAELSDLHAVDDASVHVVTEAPLAAVVSSVDAERFSAPALRRNLEDLGWLETIARAHDSVVSGLANQRPLAPVRLATVFMDEDNVRALLRSRSDELVRTLDRIRGRVEWAVKAFSVAPDREQPIPGSSQAASPGRAYLERRRGERDSAARHRQHALDEAEAVHARLTELAIASRRYPPQDRRLTGFQDEMVLNAAYLLPEGGDAELRRLTEESGSPRLRLELTGPWAPYSFATLESQ